MTNKKYYFTTRDLLLIASLAALGGITSAYINAIGDLVQSALGFAGTTQWAAGLHVLWIVLAMGFVRKPGTGTTTGVLKGAVELLTGNTHGLLVVFVDIVAGVLVDFGFLPFKDKNKLSPYLIAGGLASASNVFVFQLFASLPADILAYGAILLVGTVAFVSGMIFAGILGYILINSLRNAGVVKDQEPRKIQRSTIWLVSILAIVLVFILGGYLKMTLKGPPKVSIGGDVTTAYEFPENNNEIELITVEASLRDVKTRYEGYPLLEIIKKAQPISDAHLVLLRSSDGYAFFITIQELNENPNIILAPSGTKDEAFYDVVGPLNSKAWVRSVGEIVLISLPLVEIGGAIENPIQYNPIDWQYQMDSANLDVGFGLNKYQGAPLNLILEETQVSPEATKITLFNNQEQVNIPLDEIMKDKEIRLFSIMSGNEISFSVASMDGKVFINKITKIEVE
jgi:ABC-type thiamin/hydroxymethylpyrimidine transport system permease subunit